MLVAWPTWRMCNMQHAACNRNRTTCHAKQLINQNWSPRFFLVFNFAFISCHSEWDRDGKWEREREEETAANNQQLSVLHTPLKTLQAAPLAAWPTWTMQRQETATGNSIRKSTQNGVWAKYKSQLGSCPKYIIYTL